MGSVYNLLQKADDFDIDRNLIDIICRNFITNICNQYASTYLDASMKNAIEFLFDLTEKYEVH